MPGHVGVEATRAKQAATGTAPLGAPEQVDVSGRDDYLAAMTKVVFQSGMGRTVVDAKWDGFLAAFEGIHCEMIAALSPDDVGRLCTDQRVIRNRRKIEATIHNAQKLLQLDEPPGFAAWLASHASEAERDEAIRREFKFLGPAGIREFLWVVGETTVAECGP